MLLLLVVFSAVFASAQQAPTVNINWNDVIATSKTVTTLQVRTMLLSYHIIHV